MAGDWLVVPAVIAGVCVCVGGGGGRGGGAHKSWSCWSRICSAFANGVDPDQLASSEKQ